MKKSLILAALLCASRVLAGTDPVATFESLTTNSDSLLRDESWSDGNQYWESGQYTFNTAVAYGGTYYAGTTVSAYTSNKFSSPYGNDIYFSSCGGAYEGNQFAVFYADSYIESFDPSVSQTEARVIPGTMITNAAYLEDAIVNGNSFCRKFGQDDWFLLTITGYNGDTKTGEVEYYLADFRSDETWVYAKQWQWLDLSALGAVTKVTFALSSTDNGEYGMNTPSLFCLDNFGCEKPSQVAGLEQLTPTQSALENVREDSATKVLQDGKIIIRANGNEYDLFGRIR